MQFIAEPIRLQQNDEYRNIHVSYEDSVNRLGSIKLEA